MHVAKKIVRDGGFERVKVGGAGYNEGRVAVLGGQVDDVALCRII